MWYKPSLHEKGLTQIRHECSYYDNMKKFGWEKHDGESYAKQTIEDPENGAKLTVQWVKPEFETDPNHWVLRVDGEALEGDESEMKDISFMWYLSTPDELTADFENGTITGTQPDAGKYYLSS